VVDDLQRPFLSHFDSIEGHEKASFLEMLDFMLQMITRHDFADAFREPQLQGLRGQTSGLVHNVVIVSVSE
jgi:hypothetical protein